MNDKAPFKRMPDMRIAVKACMWLAGSALLRWAAEWHGRANLALMRLTFDGAAPALADVLPWRVSALENGHSTKLTPWPPAPQAARALPEQSEDAVLAHRLYGPLLHINATIARRTAAAQARMRAPGSIPPPDLFVDEIDVWPRLGTVGDEVGHAGSEPTGAAAGDLDD